MSARLAIIPAAAVDDESLTHTDLRVLCALGTYLGKDASVFPKQRTIATRLQLSRETVNRSIRRLRDAGYINVTSQFRDDGGQAASRYQVRLDDLTPVTPCDHSGCDALRHTGGDANSVTPGVMLGVTPIKEPKEGTKGRKIKPDGFIPATLFGDANNHNHNHIDAPFDEQKPRKERRSGLPDGFPDSAAIDAARAKWREKGRADIDAATEAEKFRAHHESKGTVAASWPATWRTWYLNAVAYAPRSPQARDDGRERRELDAIMAETRRLRSQKPG